MIQWLAIGALVATLAAGIGGYVKGRTDATERYAGELAQCQQTVEGWITVAAEQSAKVDEWQRVAAKRKADVETARRTAEGKIAGLEAKVQSLLAEQPAYPEDACRSACSLLSRPL